MAKRPSNILLKVVIAISAILGIYVLGSWLLQLRPDTDDSGVTDASLKYSSVVTK